MGGAEVVHEIRRIDPGAPAMVITAHVGDDALEAARREGLLAVLAEAGRRAAAARAARRGAPRRARRGGRGRRRASPTTSARRCAAPRLRRGHRRVGARDRAARAGPALLRPRRPAPPRRAGRRGDAPPRARSIPGLPMLVVTALRRGRAPRAARGPLHEAVRHAPRCSPRSSGSTARAGGDRPMKQTPRRRPASSSSTTTRPSSRTSRRSWRRPATPCAARAPAPPRSRLAREGFDVALVDLRLPDGDGTALAPQLKEVSPDGEVVLLTGFATLESAVAAVRAGACAYLVKPCATQELLVTVEQAMRQVRLHAREAGALAPRPDGGEARRGRHDDRRPLPRDPQPAQRRRAPALRARAAHPPARPRGRSRRCSSRSRS